MDVLPAVLLTALGAALVAAGLWDMYHGLLHPSGRGALSHGVMAGVWRAAAATRHRWGSTVGPTAMVSAVLLWVALQGLGWALVYLPHVPDGFSYSPGLDPSRYGDFAEAAYISLVTLATLGFGDVVAVDPVIRLAMPLEALAGFALLTAALSWFTQVYPPLSRRRALALELHGLRAGDHAARLARLDPVVANHLLGEVALQVRQVRIDLAQHGESYFFREQDAALSLAHQVPYALELRDAAAACPGEDLQAAADALSTALEQLAGLLDRSFLKCGGTVPEVLAAWAEDHGHEPSRPA